MAKKETFNDLGLGTKSSFDDYRFFDKEGNYNVRKTHVSFWEKLNLYHLLITMSWLKFVGLILAGYLVANFIFAAIYILIGVDHLTGIGHSSTAEEFMEAFFFSAQTITTLGYGRVAPIGFVTNIVAAIESMLGLLLFALVTGLLYGRFSKPKAKLKYSRYAVIAPYQNVNAFMFRLVNPLRNQLLEIEATVTLSMKRADDSGKRDFFLLELERSNVIFFPFMWTIVHPITENSPLFGLNEAAFLAKDVEIIILMKAFDESFSQTVYSRNSYKASDVRWGEKFVYTLKQEDGMVLVDVGSVHQTESATLNGQAD
jgi:inward rectifier potassium channel